MTSEHTISGEELGFDLNCWYYMTCCDCGLVHYQILRPKNKKEITMKIFRDDWMTRGKRREISDRDLDSIISVLNKEKRRRTKAGKGEKK